MSRTAIYLGVALALSGATACSGGASSQPPQPCIHLPTSAPGAGGVESAKVVLDVSMSMRGFIGKWSITPFQHLLRTWLKEGLTAVGLPNPELLGVAGKVRPLGSDLESHALRRALYDQRETDVVAALLWAGEQPKALSIIVTDNVQDVLSNHGQRARGFDRAAFSRAVVNLAAKGFGVWLVGFQCPFSGTYYSVRLSQGTVGPLINAPLHVEGRRPAYVWVVSRDLDKGRAVVSFLHDEISRDSKEGREVWSLELAPGRRPTVIVHKPSVAELRPSAPQPGAGSLPAMYLHPYQWPSSRTNGRTDIRLEFQRRGGADERLLLLKIQLREPSPPHAWQRTPTANWQVVVRVRPDDGMAIVGADLSAFTPTQPAPQGMHYTRLAVSSRDLLKQRDPLLEVGIGTRDDVKKTYQWVTKWSAADDRTVNDVQAKTLYLEDVLHGVLKQTLGGEQMQSCLHVSFLSR